MRDLCVVRVARCFRAVIVSWLQVAL